MIQTQITLSDKHFRYLQQRAQNQGSTVDQIVSDLIEVDLNWQKRLYTDPMRKLIGQIKDEFDTGVLRR